ncbi:retrovirus-related pol polyprotein from transposon TNT 1-94 [Tanacetum coccineum]
MKEGAFVADHVNEFNSILSRLMSVDIKFDDEVQALLLLSSLPESWSDTVTTISGSTGMQKTKAGVKSKTEGRSRTERLKPVASKDKEVNMAIRDYDDALVCCVENTIEDRIMDSGASFHATFCKEELEKFRLRFGKVRLAYDKTLDIVAVGDVVLKTSFARGNKRGSLYMVEVPSNGINVAIDGRGNTALWHQRLGHMSEKGMKILASKGRIPDLQKAVVGFYVNSPTSVASIGGSRYYVTFIDDDSRKAMTSNNV